MSDITFTLESGRRVGVSAEGSPAGDRIVVFCHPEPGSATIDPDPAATADSGVHMVALDRPGYGASEPLPDDEWPTVARFADDVAEYLIETRATAQEVSTRPFTPAGVVGWGAGGRVALGLAARHPHLVGSLVVASTPAPQEESAWVPAETEILVRDAAERTAAEARSMLRGRIGAQLPSGAALDDEDPIPLDVLGVGDADAAVLDPAVRGRLDVMLRQAYARGPEGVASDVLAHLARPWGFELGAVAAPALLLYGEDDPLAGPEHARWYADHLPDATVRMVPDVGMLALVAQWRVALDFIARGAHERPMAELPRAEGAVPIPPGLVRHQRLS